MLRILGHSLAILLLTALTQIGGLAYLLALLLRGLLFRHSQRRGLALLAIFVLLYGGATVALDAGVLTRRASLPCWEHDGAPLVSASPLTCLLNRHYVTPGTYNAIATLAGYVNTRFPGTLTQTLDAGFPFLDGFPLLPQLSHDDGRKVDLAFYYKGPDGAYRRGALPSPLGYWGFTLPAPGEPQPCTGTEDPLSLRWNMGWFQPLVRDDLTMDEARSKAALQWLTTKGPEHDVERILLEPHLKSRLGIASNRVRFQGCRAARHDDHIHIEISR
ncbi:MAG: hypothetical protein ACFB13_18950 [Kiloniellaceae bacterium]